jgi:DNA-binding MarR family transcriptional regulator
VERSQQPTGLAEDEKQTWMALVRVLVKLPAALDAQLQRDAGMNHFEYWVLQGLSHHPGGTMRMSDLAVLTKGSLSRLSQVVARLEKRGWVRRTPDPTDGRYTLAILTDAGCAKLVEAMPGHAQAIRDFVLDPLTKAQPKQLRDICNRISRAIDPDPDGMC